jgi:hypothetical protein
MNPITQAQPSTIMPPAPPSTQVAAEQAFIPGEFEYADQWDRTYLKDAYQVISRNEWWGQFTHALTRRGVDSLTGFQFSEDPFYRKIMNAISNTPIGGGHSGSSMGCTMRVMETIAIHGEAEYRRQVLEYQAESLRNKNALRIQRQIAEELRRQIQEEIQIEEEELNRIHENAIRVTAQEEELDRSIPVYSIIEPRASEPLIYNNLYVCANVDNFKNIEIVPKDESVEERPI